MDARRKPRVGIIGTGAIGGFYGVMLARAGFDVRFLMRSEFPAVLEQGLRLNHAQAGIEVQEFFHQREGITWLENLFFVLDLVLPISLNALGQVHLVTVTQVEQRP